MREKEQREAKYKVSMETKELCLIGNNASKRSERRNHKAGLTYTEMLTQQFLLYLLTFFNLCTETDGIQSAQCNKYNMLLAAAAAAVIFFLIHLFLG